MGRDAFNNWAAARGISLPTRTPAHELADSEDRRLGLKPGTVWGFKRDHQLQRDQPLTATAEEHLIQEVEATARIAKGEAIKQAEALEALATVTTEQAAAIAAAIPSSSQLWAVTTSYMGLSTAERYMLDRLQTLTGKRYSSIGTARKRCAALVPAAAPAEPPLARDSWGAPCRRDQGIFWGAVLRLDHLQGPPPADPAAFYRWALLHAYQGHERPLNGLDRLAGRMGEQQARELLDLPLSGPLAPGAARTAYRAAAATHHPDRGGDPGRFHQINEARDRLLTLTTTNR